PPPLLRSPGAYASPPPRGTTSTIKKTNAQLCGSPRSPAPREGLRERQEPNHLGNWAANPTPRQHLRVPRAQVRSLLRRLQRSDPRWTHALRPNCETPEFGGFHRGRGRT